MTDKTKSPLDPEVYYALKEIRDQRDDIKNLTEEVKDFRLESQGRITKLETKAGMLGFAGGIISGALVSALVQLFFDVAAP